MAEKTVFRIFPEMYTKKGSMSESKGLTTDLVKEDCEKQYEPPRSRLQAAACAVLLALFCCFLGLTVVRELELTGLRKDVAALSADVVSLRAAVKILEQKTVDQDLFKKIQMSEDTLYSDIDGDPNVIGDEINKGKEAQDSVEKMDTLTVREDDDDDTDDEEIFSDDEDDTTSGDYYMDYDKRMEKNAKSNLVHLKPDDFIGSVVTLHQEPPMSKIRELRKMMLEKKRNDENTPTEQPHPRNRRSVSPAADAVDAFTAPRAIFKTDGRKMKKYSSKQPDVPQPANLIATHPPMRTTRNTEDQEGNRRPFVAAHFHGNTSHLTVGVDEHYRGNGLVRTPHEAAHNVWYPSPWTAASPHPRPTLSGRGRVRVHHSGVYLVYVQVYYYDTHDTIGWVLHRTNPEAEERDSLLQCTHASPSAEPLDKPNSCFSAAAIYLRAGDRLAVRNTGGERHAIMHPEKSFIGLVKLADAEEQEQEL